MNMLGRWKHNDTLLPAALEGFDGIFRSVLNRIGDFDPAWLPDRNGLAPMDFEVGEKEVTAKLPLPGCKPEEIVVEVVGDLLSIRTERVEKKTEGEKNQYLRRERSTFNFEETVKIPVRVAGMKATAAYDDGVLTVTLPREENGTDKSHTVKVD